MKAPHRRRAIPCEIRFLLAIAGWLLPASLKREWTREWLAEFSHVFPEAAAHPHAAALRARMFARAAGAIPDAWTLLQLHGMRGHLAEAAHSRLAAVALPALLFFTLALGTNGFQGARDLLFQTESEDLVLVVQPGPFMGWSHRVPVAQAERWLRTGSTAAALGAWTVEHRTIDGLDVRVWKTTAAALDLFAHSPMQPQYDRIELSGAGMPRYAGTIARLRPGANARQAENELAGTARFQAGWQTPAVVALASIRRAPLLPVGLFLAGLWLIGALSVRVRSLRAGMWALAPVCLWFATIAGAWLECVARAPVTEAARVPDAWNMVLYVLPAAAGSFTAWWFRRSAAFRCRMCYRPLLAAVSVGMEGRCIFEPGGSEYLCAEGHGALVVGFAAQNPVNEVWTSWSGSWV